MARSRAVARACQRLRCRVRCAIRRGPSAPPSRPRKAGRGARSRKPEPSGKVGDSWPRPGRPLTGLPRREGHEPDSNLHVPGDAPRGRHDLAPLAFLVHADGQVWQFGGNEWDRWQRHLLASVADHQREDGDERGSWDPQVDPWGRDGGRVYATAMNTLTLEVYYRYDRLFGTR